MTRVDFETQKLRRDDVLEKRTNLIIIAIVVLVATTCALLIIFITCLVRRRSQLKSGENEFVSKLTKKKLFDDEERLVRSPATDLSQRPPWYSYLANKIRNKVSSEQHADSSNLSPNENYSVSC